MQVSPAERLSKDRYQDVCGCALVSTQKSSCKKRYEACSQLMHFFCNGFPANFQLPTQDVKILRI